ncbi:SDR family oxidoreductase [Clostridium perfringens]|uniref:SDR family oxidoreductase n=1 Tax=Clostridium perfringens TaxID=1502 RepID=UPI002245E7A9|nr:SDR family oxidoreductase [Clostridium perfringens]MCX0392655.1 SDR family oxidoreductase [Clostridium perfringens]
MNPYCDNSINFEKLPKKFSPQHQSVQPGIESIMVPSPIFDNPDYKGSGKLKGKSVLITGGDSGIGRAVSIAFAKEGANIVISYLYENDDAETTKKYVEKYGGKCYLVPGDISNKNFCEKLVRFTVETLGGIDVLINNAGVQFPQNNINCISQEQLELTFKINIFSMFYLTQEALKYMKRGSTIVNTTSVTAYQGKENLIDYSSTKGAVVTFTRSLSQSIVKNGIRVNAVAPGPIWTPLIVSSFSEEEVSRFGSDVPMKRAGQPFELAPAYVYLASDDSSYVTGQVLHVNGGTMVDS